MIKLSAMDATVDINRICGIAEELLNRCWMVYRINGKSEFVTSDNPIMFMDGQTFNFYIFL